MSFKCKIGLHDWSQDCGKCTQCGKTREVTHNWSKDCEKCKNCAKTRPNTHNFKDCKCSVCGITKHDYNGCKCKICGLSEHNWKSSDDFNGCTKCGATVIEISTLKEFNAIRSCSNARYILTNDIDATETKYWNNGLGFEPFKSESRYGRCEINGQDYTIRNLYINRPEQNIVSIFNSNFMISNLNIEDVYIKGRDHVGSIFCLGPDYPLAIQNVRVSGTVIGRTFVGGIIANNKTDLINCSFTGIVIGHECVGGIAGENKGQISRVHANCKITGYEQIGGLVGWNQGSILESSVNCHIEGNRMLGGISGNCKLVGYDMDKRINTIIEKCSANGEIIGDEHIGGLAGWGSNCSIVNSFSNVDVQGKMRIGGLMGFFDSRNSIIMKCIATGKVSGNDSGGILGSKLGMNDFDKSSTFWDINTSGQISSCGLTKNELKFEGKTTIDLMHIETYEDWDFTEVWKIVEGKGYPTLRCLDQKMNIPIPEIIKKEKLNGLIRYILLVVMNPVQPTTPEMSKFLLDILPEFAKQENGTAKVGLLWETKAMNLLDVQGMAVETFGNEILNSTKYIYRTLHHKLKDGEAKCFVVYDRETK